MSLTAKCSPFAGCRAGGGGAGSSQAGSPISMVVFTPHPDFETRAHKAFFHVTAPRGLSCTSGFPAFPSQRLCISWQFSANKRKGALFSALCLSVRPCMLLSVHGTTPASSSTSWPFFCRRPAPKLCFEAARLRPCMVGSFAEVFWEDSSRLPVVRFRAAWP